MNDRELLERAARAAGYEVAEFYGNLGGIWCTTLNKRWNPLEDDGDAFRLLVALGLEVSVDQDFGIAEAGRENGSLTEHYDGSSYEAVTRRAIVRASASMADNTQEATCTKPSAY